MGEIVQDGPWAGFEIISTYTRQQAIEDGVLVDLSSNETLRMFKWPIACTAAVWALIEKAAQRDNATAADYIYDVCFMAAMKIKTAKNDSDCLLFSVLLPLQVNEKATTLKLMCGPAGPADPSPCLTVMLPEED
jgi:hypothetical protein